MSKPEILNIDPYLEPYEGDILLRIDNYQKRKSQILGEKKTLSEFANGHMYYGFHRTETGWVYREWAPAAEKLYLIGDFNNWNRNSHEMTNLGNGNFEIYMEGEDALTHDCEIKVQICAHGTFFDRIPLYMKRVVQQEDKSFNGVIWEPKEVFDWTDSKFKRDINKSLFIYECHIGMSSEEYHVSSYNDFAENVLPRIKNSGYNAIQLMAIMEHPYYGSFGYQVSNFFAVSSRFGTPEDLKKLVNTAHSMNITVILDIVHSHAAPNALEGIGAFDGTDYQFFHKGAKGDHPAWGTKIFDYSKPEVIHFLLSNIKFWLDEYHFDGFRFDGITSMLYHNRGMESFDNYAKYFSLNTDVDAVCYLQLATELSKEVNPDCVLIAEDMSGMPGMCLPISYGGIGFDYRLAMGMPDYWIKTLKERKDEDWDIGQLWHELIQRRPCEKVIGYCESHDQALVGDKTIIFWLADQEMYWSMDKNTQNHIIDRAIALHKMIRFITATCAGEGYMNFMGNEFGHPEWVDFPREHNWWSYHYARRQWSLADNEELKYGYLLEFDKAMIELLKDNNILMLHSELLLLDGLPKVLVFRKGDFLFIFNFHPYNNFETELTLDYFNDIETLLNSNWKKFGGYVEDNDRGVPEFSVDKSKNQSKIKININNRSAVVYRIKTL